MDIEKIYDELCQTEQLELKGPIMQKKGIFKPSDLINVFSYTYFFSIDKEGMLELLQNVINKINYNNEDISSFDYVIKVLKILQNELISYFGVRNLEINRLAYYLKSGKSSDVEDEKVCSLSQIKSVGVAECAEKVSVANNVLLMLDKLGLFKEDVIYLNGLLNMDGIMEGHAFLGLSHINSKGDRIYLIYDVINPEIIEYNSEEFYHPALYLLTEEEYKAFINGEVFNNSKFILSNTYPLKSERIYSGFHQAENEIKPKTN